jgi:hypothetical protein
MTAELSVAAGSGASVVPGQPPEPSSEHLPDEAGGTDAEARATVAFQQRFWEAQMVFLTASRTRSGLLHLLDAAEQRAALLRLAQAGRKLSAAQAR